MTDYSLDVKTSQAIDIWLKSATKAAPDVWTKTKRLYPPWDEWAKAHYGASCSRKAFTQALRMRGFTISRLSDGAIVKGVVLKPVSADSPKKGRPIHAPNPVIEDLMESFIQKARKSIKQGKNSP